MANPKKMKAWTRVQENYAEVAGQRIPTGPNAFIVRKAFEEIVQAIDAFFDSRERNTTPTLPPAAGGGGGSNLINLPYPMVVDPSSDLYPPGVPVVVGPTGIILACKIVYAYMVCDPFAAPTADTTFKFQNAPSSPSSVGTVTFAAGSQSAEAAMALTLGLGEKLHVIAPASLNGLQNLYAVLVRPELT